MSGVRTFAACIAASGAAPRMTYTAYSVLNNERGEVQQHPTFTHSVEAIAAGFAVAEHHGRTFFVREHDSVSGEAILHFFKIKRMGWQGRHEEGEAGLRKAYPYRAERLFALNEKLTQPWRWTPESDVVGVDRGLIEGGFNV